MMKVEVQPEHEWLHKLAGEWIGEADSKGPDGSTPPPWTETGRMLGADGKWREIMKAEYRRRG